MDNHGSNTALALEALSEEHRDALDFDILDLLNAVDDPFMVFNSTGNLTLCNKSAESLVASTNPKHILTVTRRSGHKPLQISTSQLLDPKWRSKAMKEFHIIANNGREFPFEFKVHRLGKNPEASIAVLVKDTYQNRVLREAISFQRSHDTLTGLGNRIELERILQLTLEEAQATLTTFALLYVDFDQFRVINDICGHFAGDQMLRQVAKQLQAGLADKDTLYRLSGDEFAIILNHVDQEATMQIAEILRSRINETTFQWSEKIYALSCSIGATLITKDTSNWADILSAADSACILAKQQGRNRCQFYNPDDRAITDQNTEMGLVSTLVEALHKDRFQLYVQSIKPLENKDAWHHEILIRLKNKQGEIISPMHFLNAAERYNLSIMIDQWVVTNTLMFLSENPQLLSDGSVFNINVSGCSINQPSFSEFCQNQIKQFNVPGEQLCFEITETSAISNISEGKSLIADLKEIGCAIALDDFGSGMSSFAYLKNLPVDYLKIDGSFVRDMASDRSNFEMVKAMSEIAHIMGMKTVAEYVENEAIIQCLLDIGVDFGQGYGIAKPRPLIELKKD